MTHLEKEIRAQPEVLSRLLEAEGRRITRIATAVKKAGIRTVFLVARGSSDNAGLYGKYLFGSRNRLVVALATPSLFTLYKKPPDLSGCLVLAISQSGESDDIRRVVDEGKRQGAGTLVVTNREKSPLAREADYVVPLHAGRERSVAATKTYTAELMTLAMLSAALRGSKKDLQDLRKVPGAARFHVSASLDLDDYVYGIAEVPTSWEPEALRAQALAARTYALNRFLRFEDVSLRSPGDHGSGCNG